MSNPGFYELFICSYWNILFMTPRAAADRSGRDLGRPQMFFRRPQVYQHKHKQVRQEKEGKKINRASFYNLIRLFKK